MGNVKTLKPPPSLLCMVKGRYDQTVACPPSPCVPCVLGRRAKEAVAAPPKPPASHFEDDEGRWRPNSWNTIPPDEVAERLQETKTCKECGNDFARRRKQGPASWNEKTVCSRSCGSKRANRARHGGGAPALEDMRAAS